MFSLIQTAIENGLDPYKYLTWLLKTANTADMDDIEGCHNEFPLNFVKKLIDTPAGSVL